jgi:SAM-dependent methyltransferase
MNYRDVLYADYSANFGGHKDYDPESQYAVYRPQYAAHLPEDRSTPVADVGCGQGEWLLWLKSLGFSDLTGIDVAASELKKFAGAEGIVTLDGIGTEVLREQEEGSFGLIHAKDLIEHLDKNEIVEFLQVCLRALKPGGELWLSTFNAQCPLAPSIHHGDFTHETALTPNSMAQALRASGFKDVRVEGSFEPPATLAGKLRRILFSLLEIGWKFRNRVMAGKTVGSAGVHADSVKPSLFGRARRPRQ